MNATEEPITFMTTSEVETTLRREKEKAYVSLVSLDFELSYSSKVDVKTYLVRYSIPQLLEVWFISAFAYDADFFKREFLQLSDRQSLYLVPETRSGTI